MVLLHCKHCSYEWNYRGSSTAPNCPKCRYKVFVKTSVVNGAIIEKKKDHRLGSTKHKVTIKTDKPMICVVGYGDVHVGAHTCNLNYARHMLRKVLEGFDTGNTDNYILGMGDYINNVKALFGRGPHPYEQESPQIQYETVLEMLAPLAERGRIIGLHEGNHEAWTREERGIDIVRNLCRELKVPQLGPGCNTRIDVIHKASRKKQTYQFYSFHGTGSARYIWTKLGALYNAVRAIQADVYLMGHNHGLLVAPGVHVSPAGTRKCYYVLTGSYLEWDGSYAQRFGYTPEKTGSPWIHLNSRRWDVHVTI